MDFKISLFDNKIIEKQAVDDIVKCNNFTQKYGLVLSEKAVCRIIKTRCDVLKNEGRIEIGGGVTEKIIKAFCSSAYITQRDYEQSLHKLIEIFYSYKNETLDLISDDDLIAYMEKSFNGICQGSFKLLAERELDNLAHNLKYGRSPDYSEDTEEIYYDE